MNLQRFQERSRQVPLILRLLCILLALTLPLYFGLTYTGPYRWLAELQQDLLHKYYPLITGLTVFIASMGAAILVLLVLGKLFARQSLARRR